MNKHITKFVDIEETTDGHYRFRIIDRKGMHLPLPKNTGTMDKPEIIHEKFHSRYLEPKALQRLVETYNEQ